MIHDKICESRKVNSVSFYAEALWVRIITKADDNGNYWRDPFRIHANCMFEKDEATCDETGVAVKQLIKAGLLLPYEADGRGYVHVADFHEYQELRGDRNAHVEHPIHPVEMGGAYTGEGLRRDVWSNQVVDRTVRQPVTATEPSWTPAGTPEVEVKEEEEGEVSASHPEGNFNRFRDAFKDAVGRATKPKPYPKNLDRYADLCRRFGQDEVLDAINAYVALHGKAALHKNKYADSNFLHDEAEDLIKAKKDGTLDSPEEESGDRSAEPSRPRVQI